jgi:hypothetical protein
MAYGKTVEMDIFLQWKKVDLFCESKKVQPESGDRVKNRDRNEKVD